MHKIIIDQNEPWYFADITLFEKILVAWLHAKWHIVSPQ